VVHVDHLPDTQIPVLSLVGGKWTTFRGFAESVADDMLRRLGRSRRVSTRDEAIGGGRDFPVAPADRAAWINELAARCGVSVERAETLLARYGTSASVIAAFCSPAHYGFPDNPLASEPSYTVREIQYLCEHEAVTHLADLLFRRTTLAISGRLTGAVLAETAAIAARALGWDPIRARREIEAACDIARQRHGMVLRDTELVH
jgi:glycerol-3-phosphate dehydrogenase